jgi:SNF2 family DNA or RNA helicase
MSEIDDRYIVKLSIHPDREHRILAQFSYNPAYVTLIKEIEGAEFIGKERPLGPAWHLPLMLGVCTDLKNLFGQNLRVEEDVKKWYKAENERQAEMRGHMDALDGDLSSLPQELPELAGTLHPYQRAAAVFGANAHNFLIADQPGLGKTLETIAAIYEGGTQGSTLIIAPKTSLESVWEKEILMWGSGMVYTYPEKGGKKVRERLVKAYMEDDSPVKWLITTPDSHRPKRVETGRYTAKGDPEYDEFPSYPLISDHVWDNVVIDECHKGAIRNPKTLTAQALYKLQSHRRIALSGTPMKNRPSDLWGTLHWLEPEIYTSRWGWIMRFCDTSNNGYGIKVGGIREDREEELQQMLSTLMIRRTKREVAPQLPDKTIINKWVGMTPAQAKIYRIMEKEAKVKLGDMDVSATNILSEFLRLKQFAACRYERSAILDDPIVPANDSGKLNMMDEIMSERDVYDGWEDDGEKVVVFSQFAQLVKLAAQRAHDSGASVALITGSFSGWITESGQWLEAVSRRDVMTSFQGDGGPNAIFITTSAGGVAITLDRASTVVFLDEMWSPADMEQAEDRCHRISRIHNVSIYYIRTKGTIDEYICNLVAGKAEGAKQVLDAWRSGVLALGA